MKNQAFPLLMFSLLLMLVITPFAGLAPLMLLLLVTGIFYVWGSIFMVLKEGKPNSEPGDLP
ncbi:conserved exported hypothetical protein [Planktothrix serta PCC 8927]|uniref:Uncharacterized protein n=1 Tax=Planktothrix serta PCC 8927 TaxID=671068 RepID=A0A7Z9E257_9CYAN|nr:hypothetical protein [Planktothrix serta]VXD19428.1 conserved exported hypothetical protein [Planktothrix serta PCC 8927]